MKKVIDWRKKTPGVGVAFAVQVTEVSGQNDFFVQSNVLCDSSFCIRKGNRTDMISYFLTNANFFSENKSVIMFFVLI